MEGKKKGLSLTTQILIAAAGGVVFGSLIGPWASLGFVSTNIIGSMADSAMVPCIVFALFFGTAMGTYTRQSGNRNLVEWVTGFNTIITNIIKAVMHVAPIGIFCLLANVAGSTGFKVIIPMIKFLGVLLLGDAVQFLIYGPLTAALCKVNPAKMPKKFAKMSMNSCGAALCYVAAIFFMAQSTGVQLTTYQMGMAILLSCLMCMGTIVVPGGSVIVYTFLASSLGLPLESIAILYWY